MRAELVVFRANDTYSYYTGVPRLWNVFSTGASLEFVSKPCMCIFCPARGLWLCAISACFSAFSIIIEGIRFCLGSKMIILN